MAKKSTLQGSKALTSGFGIQSGKVLVVGADYRINKWGDTGRHLDMHLDVVRVGEDLEPIDADDVQAHDMPIVWENKAEGTIRLLPGNRNDPNDADEDFPLVEFEVGASGNTFGSEEGGVAPFADADAVLFAKGLEAEGFKPELNDQAFAPNYIGLVLEVETIAKADLCKALKVNYKDPANAPKTAPTGWKIVDIIKFPGQKAATAKAGAKAAPKAAGSTKANGAAPAAPATSAGVDADMIADYAVECAMAAKADSKVERELTVAKFKQAMFMKGLKGSKAKEMAGGKAAKAFQDYVVSEVGMMTLEAAEALTITRNDDEVITGVSFA